MSPSFVMAGDSPLALSGACIGSVATPAKRTRILFAGRADLIALDGRGGDVMRVLLVAEPGLRGDTESRCTSTSAGIHVVKCRRHDDRARRNGRYGHAATSIT